MPVHGKGRFQPASGEHSYRPSSRSSLAYIAEYRALKRPGSAEALRMLRRVGSLVKPLMIKNGWRLPLLAEFFPNQENLLGINCNRGRKICLRLRSASSPDTFINEEKVIHTMLHELTHNVYGPHNDHFYNFLAKLEDEYWEMKRTGRWAGEGFLAPGVRLGMGQVHDVSPAVARLKAASGAERRARIASLNESGGKLGGKALDRNMAKTPGQVAAEAAQRRMLREGGCPSSQAETAAVAREAEEAERQHGVATITISDLDSEISDPDDGPTTRVQGKERQRGLFPSHKGTAARQTTKRELMEPIVVGDSDSSATEPESAQPPPKRRGPNLAITNGRKGSENVPSTVGQELGSGARNSTSRRSAGRASLSRGHSIGSASSKSSDASRSTSVRQTVGDRVSAVAQDRVAASLRYNLNGSQEGNGLAPLTQTSANQRQWACQACTYANEGRAISCAICETPRPGAALPSLPPTAASHIGPHRAVFNGTSAHSLSDARPKGWQCLACGHRMVDGAAAFWSCSQCGQVKKSSAAGESGSGAIFGGGGGT